jgi:uncharacterized membrane protein YwaF
VGAGISVWAARHPGHGLVLFSRALGLVILAGWAGEYFADAVLGIWTVRHGLPLQLTDAVSAVSVLALWTQAAMLVEVAYFWAFTVSLQVLLTPDLAQSLPSASCCSRWPRSRVPFAPC